ncbi:MAG: biopolymer transporter ExbD [bacterium]
MQISRRIPRKARIEIVPMIDTIFFLLVFFMVATLSMTKQQGLPVSLPRAATGEREIRENVTLTLTKEGRLYYNKKEILLQQLGPQLKTDLFGNPKLLVIVNADTDVLHGRVVEVMDEVKALGAARMAIATKLKDQR